MKILITGGSGLLGQYLNLLLSSGDNILSLYNSNEGNCKSFNSLKTDLTDFKKLNRITEDFKPDVVIHTAAISRPELCDELPEAYVTDVNVNLTLNLAKLCDLNNAKLIYTSTDLVYDGDSGGMVNETSKINPISLYSKTKLMGEQEIKKIFENYVILRTSLLYGIGLNNSINNFHIMYKNFREGKKTKLFYDQYRTPLSLNDAARLISELAKTDIKNETFNFGGAQRVSRVELGEMLCEIGSFDKRLIEETSMYDMTKLHKVADVSMNTDRLQEAGFKQNSIEEEILKIIKA